MQDGLINKVPKTEMVYLHTKVAKLINYFLYKTKIDICEFKKIIYLYQ